MVSLPKKSKFLKVFLREPLKIPYHKKMLGQLAQLAKRKVGPGCARPSFSHAAPARHFLIAPYGQNSYIEAMASCDSAYKYLFSNPAILCKLIHAFVEEDFSAKIQPDSLCKLDPSHLSATLQQRESDLLYEVRLDSQDNQDNQDSQTAYLYILLEFQSTAPKHMAIRLLSYISLFYERLIKEGKNSKGKLPPVFPLVLYNGDRPWNAPRSTSELISSNEIPAKYLPHFQYALIDEKRIPDEKIHKLHNLISAVICAEKYGRPGEWEAQIPQIIEFLRDEPGPEITIFRRWIALLFGEGMNESEYNQITAPEEVQKMLATLAEDLKAEGRQEGEKLGMQKGWEEGEKLGMRKGREEGREEGEKLGMRKGREEGRREAARKMKESGLSIEQIARFTGLSHREITGLREGE